MGYDDRFDPEYDSTEEDSTEEDSTEDWDQESMLEPCPHCGESIYEDAPQCPECGQYIVPGSSTHHPAGRFSAITQIVIWILIISLVLPAVWALMRTFN